VFEFFLTYCLIIGCLKMWHRHGRVVVPGNESAGIVRGFLSWTRNFIVKGWLVAFVLFFGWANTGQIASPAYAKWAYNYPADHSMVIWFFTTVPFTVVLWFLWHATFRARSQPGTIGWYGDKMPSLVTLSMKLPAFWGAVFYLWLLFSPTLPFYDCYVRGFWLHTPIEQLFDH